MFKHVPPLERTQRAFVVLAILALVGVFFAGKASAQALEVPARANVSWTLPTQTECLEVGADPATCARLPLTDALALTAIELYVATSPIADDAVLTPTSVLAGNATATVYNAVIPAGATLYIRVKARNATAISKYSNEATKVVDVPNVAPGVPTNVSIEIKIGVVPTP